MRDRFPSAAARLALSRLAVRCLAVALLAASRPAPVPLAAQPSPPAAAGTFTVPSWAFPLSTPAGPVPPPDSVILEHVPNSTRAFTRRQVGNGFDAVDWFPAQHPPMPSAVRYGVRPDGRACALCHLPDGQGRPENAALAGLPVEYIVRQVRAFRNDTRLSAAPGGPQGSMHRVAKGFAGDDDIRDAAQYYHRLRLTRRNVIREVREVPKTKIAGLLYAYDGDGTEPLDGRLIEVPETFDRHELKDPWVPYITYVPVGSLARGRRLAARGPAGAATACATCHGPRLLGVGEIPPIAGRSPSNLLRQLINFRTRARRDSTAAPMHAISDAMSLDDMVAVAAYVGALPPAPPRRRPAAPHRLPRK